MNIFESSLELLRGILQTCINFFTHMTDVKYLPYQTFYFFLITLSISIIYLFYQWTHYLRLANAVELIPTSKIRSAAQGYVKLEGKQHALFNIVASLSKIPCTWFHSKVYIRGINRKYVLHQESISSVYFLLQDETSHCIISPKNAKVKTFKRYQWYGFTLTPNAYPPFWLRCLGRLFGSYSYIEWVMTEDMPLYALGNFQSLDKDELPSQLLEYYKEHQIEGKINLLSEKDSSANRPFILSTYTQSTLKAKYNRYALYSLVGYFILLLLLIGFTFVKFY